MTKALLHCEQHLGVTARLDVDHPIRVEANEVQRWREQVAPR